MNLNDIFMEIKGKRVISAWSGGLDSTALILLLLEKLECKVLPVFINRGQRNYRNEKEAILHYYKKFSKKYKNRSLDLIEINCKIPADFFKEKYKNNDNIYVLRNSDIFNQTIRLAACEKINFITTGSNIDDDADNTNEFYKNKNEEIKIGIPKIKIIAPFLELKWNKSNLLEFAQSAKINLAKTWSCWIDNESHCGICVPCLRRINAYKETSILDSTIYLNQKRVHKTNNA